MSDRLVGKTGMAHRQQRYYRLEDAYGPPPTRKGVSCFVGAFVPSLALFFFHSGHGVLGHDLIKLSGTSKWHAVDGVVVSSQGETSGMQEPVELFALCQLSIHR